MDTNENLQQEDYIEGEPPHVPVPLENKKEEFIPEPTISNSSTPQKIIGEVKDEVNNIEDKVRGLDKDDDDSSSVLSFIIGGIFCALLGIKKIK